MDKSAIEHIQLTANIPAFIEHLSNHKTEIPIVAIPDNMSINDLERYMPNAARYRLNYETVNIADFIRYNANADQQGALCFIDDESMTAHTIFDLGTLENPLHKAHQAKLKLRKSAAYKSVLAACNNHLPQKLASDFIEDWQDEIIAFSKDGDTMTPLAAARSLRDLTIEAAKEINSKVDDFGESMSSMERVEAKHQEMLPAWIHFKCIPYQGLSERTFKLRVAIITSGEKPALSFRLLREEAIQEEIAEEFKGILEAAFEDSELDTYIGEV